MDNDVKQICLWLVRGHERRANGHFEAPQEAARVAAVEDAKHLIGVDVPDELTRQRLIKAILLNCQSGNKYPFEVLGLDGFSRRDFYRRKQEFIKDIAQRLAL